MNKEIDVKKTGEAIKLLAELLTVESAGMTVNELLEVLEGRAMTVEEVGCVRDFLAT